MTTMTNEGRKYMHSDYDIRDFGQLLSSLYRQLQNLTDESYGRQLSDK